MVQGMSIAMKKDFFIQLGGFDTGMLIWGQEQLELSIKVSGVLKHVYCHGGMTRSYEE